jgi:uncharacterized protein YjbI with pentapeptide repeats
MPSSRAALRRPRKPNPPEAPRIGDPATLAETDAPLDPELDLYRTRLTGAHPDLTGGGALTQVVVDGADFSGSRLERLELVDVVLRGADLAGARWDEVVVRRVTVESCRTIGWRLNCDLAEDMLVTDCRWDTGALHLTRRRTGAGSIHFRDCSFVGTTLRGDLSGVVFDGCDLAGAEFGATAAKGCDLRTSRLAGALGLLSLRGALITAEQAIGLADAFAAEIGFELREPED